MFQNRDHCAAHPGAPVTQECQNCDAGLCEDCHFRSELCRVCRRKQTVKRVLVTCASILVVGAGLKVLTSKSSYSQYGKHRFAISDARKALTLEPCNRRKAIDLAALLFSSHVYRETVEFSEFFLQKCGEFNELRAYKFEALKGLGEWDKALVEVSKMIGEAPGDSDLYAWRGLVYETTGQWEKAAVDFQKALEIHPELIDVPLNLATAQERLGRTCDAVATLRKVLAKAGRAEGHEEVFQKMLALNNEGKCIAATQKEVVGKALILFSPGANSITTRVKLNGHETTMIVDTGASSVTISKALASKLRMRIGGPVRISTASGIVTGHNAVVDSIRIQGVEAKNVPIVVMEDPAPGSGGLLGLTFLSRFKMEMNPAQGTLSLQSRSVGVALE